MNLKNKFEAIIKEKGLSKTKDIPEMLGKTYQAVQTQLKRANNLRPSELNKLFNPLGYKVEFVLKELGKEEEQ